MKLENITKYLGIPIFIAAIYYAGYMNLIFHHTVLGINPKLDLVAITIAGGDFYVGTIADTIKLIVSDLGRIIHAIFTKHIISSITLTILALCIFFIRYFSVKSKIYFYAAYVFAALFFFSNIFLLIKQMQFVNVSNFLSIDKSSLDFNAQSDLKQCEREAETYQLYLNDLKDFDNARYRIVNEYFNLATKNNLEKERLISYASIVSLLLSLTIAYKILSKYVNFRFLVLILAPNLLMLPATFGVLGKSYYMPYISFEIDKKQGEGYLLYQESNKKYIYQPHENFSVLIMDKEDANTIRIEYIASPFDSKIIGDIALCCNRVDSYEK